MSETLALTGLGNAERAAVMIMLLDEGQAAEILRQLAKLLKGNIPIIGVGGIMSGEHAKMKIQAGASLVQIYTGFIYRGPDLIRECARALAKP